MILVLTNKKNRNFAMDMCKAFAIISVVFGHTLFYGMGRQVCESEAYYEDIIFKIIYSVHMPVFMLISGYFFFYTSEKYTLRDILRKKFNTLLIPIISWATILLMINGFMGVNGITLYQFVVLLFKSSWFLRAVLWATLSHILVKKLFDDKIFIHVIIIVASLFVVDGFNFALFKFMYGYFFLGYYYNKYKMNKKWNGIKNTNIKYLCTIILGICWCILLDFYDYSSFIYTSGFKIIGNNHSCFEQVKIDLFRFFIGLVGSLFIITLCLYAEKSVSGKMRNIIKYIGTNCMCIYLVQGILFKFVQIATYNFNGINYFLAICECCVVLLFAIIFIKLTCRNKILSFFLYGR